MLGGMMDKLQAMQQEVEASKQKLAHVFVDGEAGNGAVKITMSADKKVKEIKLDESLQGEDLEMIEDLLVLAFNKASEKATLEHDKVMASSAQSIMPNLGL